MWLALLGSLWASEAAPSGQAELRSRLRLGPTRVRLQKGRSGWTSKAAPIAGHTVLDADGERFYHATTNLSAVIRSGRLLSRRDLSWLGVSAAGLGGGWANEAPDQVSLAVGRPAADRVAAGLRLMAEIVAGRVTGPTALERIVALDAAVSQPIDRDLDDAISDAEDRVDEVEMEVFGQVKSDIDAATILLQKSETPRHIYAGVVAYEGALLQAQHVLRDYHWTGDGVVSPIGFTVPFDQFRVDPDEVGVVEVAVRQGASIDVVPDEAEVRVRPEDTRVLRAWRPAPMSSTGGRAPVWTITAEQRRPRHGYVLRWLPTSSLRFFDPSSSSSDVEDRARVDAYIDMIVQAFLDGTPVEPVEAILSPKGVRITDGNHRSEAARRANVPFVPVFVREAWAEF